MQSFLFCACALDFICLILLIRVIIIKKDILPSCFKHAGRFLIPAAAVPAVFVLLQAFFHLPYAVVPVGIALGELPLIYLVSSMNICNFQELSKDYAYSNMEGRQKALESEVRRKTETIRGMQVQMIINFANIVESRDVITGGHIKRTSQYVRLLIEELIRRNTFPQLNDPDYAEHICLSAPLHDIGKIAIPDSILCKTTTYTPEEFEIMKSHTWLGGQILDKTMSSMEDQDYYWLARNMAVYHHERWDGKGYPKKLRGTDIPLCARIMAVADVFDALTSLRPYKEALTFHQAFEMIRSESGNHFDPDIVEAFLGLEDQLKKTAGLHQVGRAAS